MAKYNVFEIHTPNKMYTIKAAYFTANTMGVMFFDNGNRGIGFVPNVSLDLVRINTTEEELHEEIKASVGKFIR